MGGKARITTLLIIGAVLAGPADAQDAPAASSKAAVDRQALEALIDDRVAAALGKVEQRLAAVEQQNATLAGTDLQILAAVQQLQQLQTSPTQKDRAPIADRLNLILGTLGQALQLKQAYDQLDPPEQPGWPPAVAAAPSENGSDASDPPAADPPRPPTDPGPGPFQRDPVLDHGVLTGRSMQLPTTRTTPIPATPLPPRAVGGTNAALVGHSGQPYEIVPDPSTGQLGKLLVTFPAGVGGTQVEVYRSGTNTLASRGSGTMAATLSPGRYSISVSDTLLDVDVRRGHETRVRPGGLRVGVRGSKLWRLLDAGGGKQLHQKYGGGTVGLLPGQYVVSIDGAHRSVTIRTGQITGVK